MNPEKTKDLFQSAGLGARLIRLAPMIVAMGIKDAYTQAHAHRVAAYARRLAARAAIPAAGIECIWLGGLLHDIGKIGLSHQILRNTKIQLPKAMLAEVRRHPSFGARILKHVELPAAVTDYVLYHHEKIDGTGYPCGLRGDEIPLGAKIISVADCFDAITTDRPYQKGKNPIEALAILRQISAKSLCPDLVKKFAADIQENGVLIWPQTTISLLNASPFPA